MLFDSVASYFLAMEVLHNPDVTLVSVPFYVVRLRSCVGETFLKRCIPHSISRSGLLWRAACDVV